MNRPERLDLVCPQGCRLARVQPAHDGLTVTPRRGEPEPLAAVDLVWLNCRHRLRTVPPLNRADVQHMWTSGQRGRVLAYDPDRPYDVDWEQYASVNPYAVVDEDPGLFEGPDPGLSGLIDDDPFEDDPPFEDPDEG